MTIAELVNVLDVFSRDQDVRVEGRVIVTGPDGRFVIVDDCGLKVRPTRLRSLEWVTDQARFPVTSS